MNNILLYYQRVSPTTWVYLSSLLVIALFFKFNRVWSVRNLDLIGLILFAPGLLLALAPSLFPGRAADPAAFQQAGYVWLFVVGGLFMIRMLLDPIMVRRPLLEPNLTVGGLTFLGLSLLVFQLANVVTDNPAKPPAAETQQSTDLVETPPVAPEQQGTADSETQPSQLKRWGPGYPWVLNLFQIPTRLLISGDAKGQPAPHEADENTQRILRLATARTVAIFSYLAIVIGLVFVGYRHFDNIRAGIAAAVLYLLLPYTAILTGHPDAIYVGPVYHVLLAALLVWAVAAYRRPLVSGVLLGLSIGMFYYPIFLLPLWCSFYWQRGLLRFAGGVVAMIVLLVGILYFNPYPPSFAENLRQMFGWIVPRMEQRYFEGFWHLQYNAPVFRIPVLAAFIAMCITLAIWPAQKNLGTLMSCSAAVMLGTQFWHATGGGQLMGWYLPLLLLTIFRPNLEDRVALSVLGQWSFARRKPRLAQIDQAA
jgi:hypothetical protein